MNRKHNICIIDDEENLGYFLQTTLTEDGFQVHRFTNLYSAKEALRTISPDLILLDVNLPDGNGIEFLQSLKEQNCSALIIIMTAYGSINQAISAIKVGAVDYLQKPFDLEELKLKINQVLKQQSIKSEINYFRERDERIFQNNFLFCQSEVMQKVYDLVKRVALSTNTSVLIEGESGTGKEMIAKMIHKYSPRKERPIVDLNCASIPETLMESELFGFEQGAFTGATKRKIGLFEVADNSSLILDEISEMPYTLQAKLLRVLETQTIRRLGSVADISVDFRLIAITNRNLKDLVKQNLFREDLFFRISVVPIKIPPLRKHKEDIIQLAEFFVERFQKNVNKRSMFFSNSAIQKLLNYSWPGNIRELKNVIERAVILSNTNSIESDDLLIDYSENANLKNLLDLPESGIELTKLLETLKDNLIEKALAKCGGNQVKAAELLSVPRHVIRYYLEKKSGTNVENSQVSGENSQK